MPALFVIMNHRIAAVQEADARTSLGVDRIVEMPEALAALWSQIPSDLEAIGSFLKPVQSWLSKSASPGDYVLIQGDFGACYLMVVFSFSRNLIPIYSTTSRVAVENHYPDGTVEVSHRFKHRLFRRYGS